MWLTVLVMIVAACCVRGVMYTYQDFTPYTIPGADGLNISAHFICFGGWVMMRYPSMIEVLCNDSLSEALWPNEPGLVAPSIASNYPPSLIDVSGLWLATEWYAFGVCPDSIVQCNASVPITNHTYEDSMDTCPNGVTYVDGEAVCMSYPVDSPSTGCPTNVVNYYNVCSNVAFMAMTYPMDNFEKSVWSRDQLWEFSYVHCNTTQLASELGAYVAESRNHVDVDFSWFAEQISVFFWVVVSLLFFVGCCVGIVMVAVLYVFCRRKAEERTLKPWSDDPLVNLSRPGDA